MRVLGPIQVVATSGRLLDLPSASRRGLLARLPWTPRGHCGWISCMTCFRSVTFGLFGTAARSARVQAGPGSLLANPLAGSGLGRRSDGPPFWPRRVRQ